MQNTCPAEPLAWVIQLDLPGKRQRGRGRKVGSCMTEMLAAGEEYMQLFPFHRLTDVLVALDR